MTKNIDLMQRITTDTEICHGKPTIRGSRIMVKTILELLASGMTNQEILEDYPKLETEDIWACLAFATRLVDFRSINLQFEHNIDTLVSHLEDNNVIEINQKEMIIHF